MKDFIKELNIHMEVKESISGLLFSQGEIEKTSAKRKLDDFIKIKAFLINNSLPRKNPDYIPGLAKWRNKQWLQFLEIKTILNLLQESNLKQVMHDSTSNKILINSKRLQSLSNVNFNSTFEALMKIRS